MTTRRWLAALLLLSSTIGVVLLAPAALAPVHADDRYWYLMIGGRAASSLAELARWSVESVPDEVRSGRIATLAAVERRLIGLGAIELSVATAVPVVAYQALVKYLLTGAGILSILAMVRSLRWRATDGALVQVSSRSLWLIAIALPVAVTAGVQTQSQFRNGWTSYAVLTYGAVVAIFATVALLLWLTRLTAERPRIYALPSVLVLVVLAAATTVSYELVLPGVVVAAAALVVVPVTEDGQRSRGVKAKLTTGAAYIGGFGVFFAAARTYLADLCTRVECYEGVTPSIGRGVVDTGLYNFVTALALGNNEEALADVRRVGWEQGYADGPTWWSVALAGLVAVILVLAWKFSADLEGHLPRKPAESRAEGTLLVVGAALAAAGAVGTAAIMALSVQAQEIVQSFGVPYRNTMVTWAAVAGSAVLGAAGLRLLLPPRVGALPWMTCVAVVGTLVATSIPVNLTVTRAYRALPELQATEAIHLELAIGDTAPEADLRRCQAFARVSQTMGANSTVDRIHRHANRAFEHYHGLPFCSDANYPE